MQEVFTNEYLCFDAAAIDREVLEASKGMEIANLRHTIMEILDAAGGALHSNFVSGDEPKWKHPSQRESLIQLSNLLEDVHKDLMRRPS